MWRHLWLLGMVVSAACAATRQTKDLQPAIAAYHEFLRWKQYSSAARFRLPDQQSEFVARYSAAEDDLYVNSVEVRSVRWSSSDDDIVGADVTVVAHAYLLPSTVVEKIIMVERWEQRDGSWSLVRTSHELAPPAPVEPTPAPRIAQ